MDTSSASLDQKGSSGNGMGYNSTTAIYYRLNKKVFLTAAISCTGSLHVNFSIVRSGLTTTQGRPADLNFSIGIGLTW